MNNIKKEILEMLNVDENLLVLWQNTNYSADIRVSLKMREVLDDTDIIIIAGDYDCDGLCATHITETACKELYKDKKIYTLIPTRKEGYGLNERIVNFCKNKTKEGKVCVITVDTGIKEKNKLEDIIAAKNEDVLQNQFLLDATFLGYYSDETLKIAQKLCALNQGMLDIEESDLEIMKKAAKENDYLGMNYYQSRFIQAYDGENDIYHNGTGEKGTSRFRLKGVGERMNKEGIDRTDWDWLIHPESMFDMLVRIKQQYPQYKAIYITENGMGYKDDFEDDIIDDTPRIDYVRRHLYYLLKAIEAGVNVKGYFIWSLMDMFSWTNGYNKRYGLFYIDYKTQKRYPKASAYWYKYISQTKELF